MNYRRAYHAGNFGDVLKHAILAPVLSHLKQKEATFRVIDTHAGLGRYELDQGPAEKTGEWRQGIGRLLGPAAKPMTQDIAKILGPYVAAVAGENAPRALTRHPGRPLIARTLLRDQH